MCDLFVTTAIKGLKPAECLSEYEKRGYQLYSFRVYPSCELRYF